MRLIEELHIILSAIATNIRQLPPEPLHKELSELLLSIIYGLNHPKLKPTAEEMEKLSNYHKIIIDKKDKTKLEHEALYLFALCKFEGLAIERDLMGAKEILKCIYRHHVYASYHLGSIYLFGIPEVANSKRIDTAEIFFHTMYQYWHPCMQYSIGLCYFDGTQVGKNYKTAFKFLFASAKQKYIPALYLIARCYELGTGIKADASKSLKYYCSAAELGDPGSADVLLDFNIQDNSIEPKLRLRAQKALEKALNYALNRTNNGDSNAAFFVGRYYDKSINRNFRAAIKYYFIAIKMGYVHSEHLIQTLLKKTKILEASLKASEKLSTEKLICALEDFIFAFDIWLQLHQLGNNEATLQLKSCSFQDKNSMEGITEALRQYDAILSKRGQDVSVYAPVLPGYASVKMYCANLQLEAPKLNLNSKVAEQVGSLLKLSSHSRPVLQDITHSNAVAVNAGVFATKENLGNNKLAKDFSASSKSCNLTAASSLDSAVTFTLATAAAPSAASATAANTDVLPIAGSNSTSLTHRDFNQNVENKAPNPKKRKST